MSCKPNEEKPIRLVVGITKDKDDVMAIVLTAVDDNCVDEFIDFIESDYENMTSQRILKVLYPEIE